MSLEYDCVSRSYFFCNPTTILSKMLRYVSWVLATLLVVTRPVMSKPMPSPVAQAVQPSTSVTPGGSACGQNNATNRACWKNNWNINTDYETTTPPGTTRNVGYKRLRTAGVAQHTDGCHRLTSTSQMSLATPRMV